MIGMYLCDCLCRQAWYREQSWRDVCRPYVQVLATSWEEITMLLQERKEHILAS